MTPSPGADLSSGIVRVVALYATFAALWIFGSDWLLGQIVSDAQSITQLSVIKGWAFVGVSATLLYGALRRMVHAPVAAPRVRQDWLPVAGFVAAVALLAAAAMVVVYEQARRREGARLEAIAALKVQDISAWFRHRASETEFVAGSRYFAGLFRSVVGGDEAAKAILVERIAEYAASNEYHGYAVHAADGRLLVGDSLAQDSQVPALAAAIREAVSNGKVGRVGGYSERRSVPVLYFVAPLRETGRPAAGAIALRVDPRESLLKSAEAWPVPGQDGQTLLVRRQGDVLLGLRQSDPRGNPVPVSTRNQLVGMVMLGKAPAGKAILANDFRGAPVLGVALPVPGTEWYLAARIPRSELYAAVRGDLVWIVALALSLLFGIGIVLRLQGERAAHRTRAQATRLLEGIADSSTDVIYVKDLNGAYLLANREVERVVGRSRKELLGKDDRALFPPGEAEALMARDRAIVEGGRPVTLEEVATTADGSVTYLSTKGPLRDAEGRVIGLFGISRDITALKTAQEALRAQDEVQRTMVSALAEGVLIFGADGVVRASNPSGERILGLSAEEMRAEPLTARWTLLREDGTPFAVEDLPLSRTLATGEACHGVVVGMNRVDGSRTWLLVNSQPLGDPGSGRIDGAVVSFSDISHRHAAEEELRKLSLAVEQSPGSVVITDVHGTIEYVNAAFERTSGWSAADAVGRNPRILKSGLTHPAVYASLWETLAGGQVWKGELVNRRRNGEIYHEVAHIAPIRAPDGRITHFVALKDDVTEHKRLAEELEQHRYHLQDLVAQRTRELEGARAAAEAASRAKSAFLANMSHEIRTPMNAILGLAHLLRRDSVQPVQRERLAKLSEAAQHLLQILNDILDLSKVESGKLQLEVSAFELPDLLARTCGLVEEAARAKGIVVSSEPPASPRVVRGDRTRLAQALLNLVGNAVKFTERGSVRVACDASGEADGRVLLRFTVADTGVGVPEDARERLFLAFEQADTSTTRRFGGTGLGLAITRRLAQLMGGDAGLERTSAAGSTFWFTARVELTDEAPQPAMPAAAPAPEEGGGGPRRVLLAEDDPVNQEVATELLESEGYHVTVVDTGAEAVARASGEPFDLILMDVQMPQMDGLEATREIRRLPAHAKTPIVAMTANAFSEDREACLAAGMDAHVANPVDAKVLAATLRQWLGGSDAPEAKPAAVAAAPADKAAALGILRELEALLAASDFRAGATFSTHESGLAAADPVRAATLGASLRQFDYEQSLQVARAWREALEKEGA